MKIRLFFVFLFSCHNLCSGGYPPQFRHLNINNGLSQNSVQCILQDKNGFMWFGTQDGLNRYDGYSFRLFKNDNSDKNSLTNNYILKLYEDSDGIIWIGTFGGGLNSFDPVSEKFTSLINIAGDNNSLSSNRIFSIAEFPKGILWVGTNDGLNRLEKSSGKIQRFFCTNNNSDATTGNFIGSICNSGNEFIWFSGDDGLKRFNVKDFTLSHFTRSPFSGAENLGSIYSIDNISGKLFVSCEAGIMVINTENETDTMMLKSSDVFTGDIKPVFVKCIQTNEDNYWIGTGNGLIHFDKAMNSKSIFTNYPLNEHSLINNSILSLYKSADGVIWIGTRNGLDVLYNNYSDFGSFVYIADEKNLSHKSVNAVAEDDFGNLWICTVEGLNFYNKEENSFSVFKKGSVNSSLTSSYFLSVSKTKNGSVWAGTRNGGLYRFDITGKNEFKMKKIQPDGLDMKSTSIHFICEDKSGIIWLGTAREGLLRYEPAVNKIKQYLKGTEGDKPGHPYVFTIMEDSFGNLWLGTASGGLNLFDRKNEKFIYFQNDRNKPGSISNNIILSLHEDLNHNLWVGTSGGLNKLNIPLQSNFYETIKRGEIDIKTVAFTNYGMKSGLPNEVIYGIQEDRSGNFWLSTNKGLAQFNPFGGKNIKTYDSKDGLLNNEYNQNGYYHSKNGEMYFGGVNGLNYFNPEKITINRYIPPVRITGFRLYYDNILTGVVNKHGLTLNTAVHEIDELELEYHHKVLTFDYAAFGYAGSEKIRYMYKMEGFDKDWIEAGNIRAATYTNLDAGNYVFKVKAANSDGFWNDEGASLKIYIPPPPWLSWYAYLFYIIIFLLLTYIFIRGRIRTATRELEVKARIEKAKVEERENFRKEASRDFHDESGNRITRINLFTELAKLQAEDKPQLKEYLNKIEKNSLELSAGLRDFIWSVDPEKDSLFDILIRLKDFGFSMFSDSNILFRTEGLNPEFNTVKLPIQVKRSIILIFKEAMNNTLKYSGAGNVCLNVFLNNKKLKISLQDNGKGFDIKNPDNQKGYGLSNMKARAEKVGGKLSVTSAASGGSNVTFICDIQQMSN